jgi:DNA adenine methylase
MILLNERATKYMAVHSAIRVPPIKCQGIKTKLVSFIASSIHWQGNGRWIEPFVGSGVVVLNIAPNKALLSDINVHVIQFYKDISTGLVSPEIVRDYLEREGQILLESGEKYYYEIRARFNANPSSLDFLFLNRSCFNGMVRFNSKGEFNVPSGRKPERFRKAYITKIVNQLTYLRNLVKRSDWIFEVSDWRKTLEQAKEGDFVYADPPYLGRHTDYYNKWDEKNAQELDERLRELPCGFALSTWKQNRYRINPYLPSEDDDRVKIKTFNHFYHIGPTESLRNPMQEALVIKRGFESHSSISNKEHFILA